MTDVTPAHIQELRAETGAGMMDAKRALAEARGDFTKAVELLRKTGQKIAAAKQERSVRGGTVGAYIHANSRIAALVELTCETDFVARTEEFRSLAHDLALHIAAMNPLYLDAASIPVDVREREERIAREMAEADRKPAAIIPKIVEGRLMKFAAETCLLDQPFVKEETQTIRDLLTAAVHKFGERITIRRFVRFSL